MLRLKELREFKKVSQTAVSDFVQTSRTNISRWEKGLNEPTMSPLIKLADFFGCSIDYLVGREDEFGNVSGQGGYSLNADELELVELFRGMDTFFSAYEHAQAAI